MARRCCCRYSEASGARSSRGLTMDARERCERFPVRERCWDARFVFVVLYWLNLDLISLSMLAISCKINQPRGMVYWGAQHTF